MSKLQDEWKVTLGQFIKFLTHVERSAKCPVCPHEGEWRFYIDSAFGAQRDSYMTVSLSSMILPDQGEEAIENHPYYTMECPNCGYTLRTSAKRVIDVLTNDMTESQKNG